MLLTTRRVLLSLATLASLGAAVSAQCPITEDPQATLPTGCGPLSPVRRAWGGKIASSCFRATPTARLWLGEDGGRIRLSTDLGATWTEQEVPIAVQGRVRGIFFLTNSSTGFAVTSDGFLLKTVNDGACWTVQAHFTDASGNDAELFDVYFFGPARGTVAGAHLLQSTGDGGVNWSEDLVSPAFNPPNGLCGDAEIYALDLLGTSSSFLAVASTEPGAILWKSLTSGGWQVAYTPTPQTGGLCGGPIETWDVEIAPGSTPTDAVVYAVSGQGNHCGGVYRGEFNGSSWCWTQENHDCQGATPAAGCASANTEDIYTCPLDRSGWTSFESLYGVYALSREKAVAVGYGGQIVYREAPAGGSTGCLAGEWIDITDRQYFSTAPLITITGDDVGTAWTGGMFGDVRRIDLTALAPFVADPVPLQNICIAPATPQTPRPYIALGPQTPWRMNNVWFSSATSGWAVGRQGQIARWDDAASTWRHVRSECAGVPTVPSATLNSIVFADATRGLAVGNRVNLTDLPTMYFTRTGGPCAPDWSPFHTLLAPPSAARGDLLDVEVKPGTNPPEFWAVGGTDLIGLNGVPYALRIHKPGTSWALADVSPVSLPNTNLHGLEFFGGANAHLAIVVGGGTGNGQVWLLDTSTSLFTPVSLPGSEPLFTDVAVAGNQAWIVGHSNGSTAVVLHNPDFPANPGAFVHIASAELAAGNVNLLAADAVPNGAAAEVFASGTAGTLLHSLDGINFLALDSETHKPIKGISVPQLGRAWMMGSSVEFDDPDAVTLRY